MNNVERSQYGSGRLSLREGAEHLGIALSGDQLHAFAQYSLGLRAWNKRFNLTAIVQPDDIEESHFVDSLTIATVLPEGTSFVGRLLDVGTGGGFPGIPLKIALPAISLTLLEATGKKVTFLREIASGLGLSDVEVLQGRAEDFGRNLEHRDAFDVVVARALGGFPVALELCLPFVRVGGLFIAQMKGQIQPQISEGRGVAVLLGSQVEDVVSIDVLGGDRVLVVVRKLAQTPDKYPRRAGIPAKRPLKSV
ncbi:MAG: 16S rRNA (guanine527-N7)-methyltransferase [Chloroflexi bacterium]|nr:MAG: 16S rRNA (guanine527-N7)-methyltransferase [Chloroflexota bacterium]